MAYCIIMYCRWYNLAYSGMEFFIFYFGTVMSPCSKRGAPKKELNVLAESEMGGVNTVTG